MAQFVKLENGSLLNTAWIVLIRPLAGIKYDMSGKIKVHAEILAEWADGASELISVTAVAPWPNPDNEVEAYNLLCSERDRLKKTICEFFPDITRGILLDLKTYYPPYWIREQLQQAAENTAERIAEELQKMEDEQNE